jgi:GR25 family glycosyltransferase involved in LPS biosynthesis
MQDILNDYNVDIVFINNNGNLTTNILNQFPIYVINLKKDIYRRAYITHLFKKLQINYKLIIVDSITIEHKKRWNIKQEFRHLGQLGCVLSHMFCLRDAIKSHYEKFIIFEDDIVFHKKFNKLFIKYLDYNLDLLLLGACDFELEENIINMNNNNDLYFPKKNALGAHANIYSLNFAKTFYDYKIKNIEITEFDKDYSIFYDDYKIGICYPNLVICELSSTNINHFFSPLKKQFHDNYLKKCFMDNLIYSDYNYIIIDLIKFIFIKKDILNKSKNYDDVINFYIDNIDGLLNKNKVKYMLSCNDYTIYDLNKIFLIVEQEFNSLPNNLKNII